MKWMKEITNIWQKSKAAAILENLLKEQQSMGLYAMDPHRTANEMVEAAWQIKHQCFDGSEGRKAHKMSLAGVALANGLSSLPVNAPHHLALFIALRRFIHETQTHSAKYHFSKLDDALMEGVIHKYLEVEQEIESATAFTKPIGPPPGSFFATHKPANCPSCSSDRVVDVLYGYPSDESFEEASRGRLILGGCMHEGDLPDWQCIECQFPMFVSRT